MAQKLIISSDFGYVSNISTIPSIIYVHKRSGGCKISSRYFSKMLSIPRDWIYQPMPSHYSPASHPSYHNKAYYICVYKGSHDQTDILHTDVYNNTCTHIFPGVRACVGTELQSLASQNEFTTAALPNPSGTIFTLSPTQPTCQITTWLILFHSAICNEENFPK